MFSSPFEGGEGDVLLAQEKSIPQAQHPPNPLQRGNWFRGLCNADVLHEKHIDFHHTIFKGGKGYGRPLCDELPAR